MEEDLELRMLKLKKMREMLAARSRKEGKEGISIEEALKVLKPYLADRADEVLEAALSQYPEAAKKIVIALASRVSKMKISGKLRGEALLSLFDYLGMPIKLRTKILYYKKGEYKTISDLLK